MRGFRRTPLGEILHALPPAIRWILLSCVGIWLLELVIFSAEWEPGLVAIEWLALVRPFPWVWQLVTYAFLHHPSNVLHVAFNMFALWMFGRELEWRWGSWPFLQFYLTCAVGAALAHVAVTAVFPGLGGPVVGASGAVLGLFAAFGLVFPERTVLAFFVVPVKAKHFVLILAVIELLVAWNPANGIAHFAHLGGMLTAWLYLRHAWRVMKIRPLGWARGKVEGLRRARRRSRFEVVDEREWDEWLRRELSEDETQH
jgi:membrane associated rhomboid family serine protease